MSHEIIKRPVRHEQCLLLRVLLLRPTDGALFKKKSIFLPVTGVTSI